MGRSAWFEEPVGIKICPLSMGDREDPTRLVFTSKTGAAVAGRQDRIWQPERRAGIL